MKSITLSSLTCAAALLFAPGASQAATVVFDLANSGAYDDGVNMGTAGPGYGSAGFLVPVAAPVSGGSGTGTSITTNPFGGTYPTTDSTPVVYQNVNTFGSAITATTDNQNTVQNGGIYYGTLPNGDFDYIGRAGTTGYAALGSMGSADEFSLTFNLDNAAGYRISLWTEGTGFNAAGSNGINFTTTDGFAFSSASNSLVENGYMSAYAFDVSNITAGDQLTVTLSQPQYNDLSYFAITADQLTAVPVVPEPSTYALLGAGVLTLVLLRRRQQA